MKRSFIICKIKTTFSSLMMLTIILLLSTAAWCRTYTITDTVKADIAINNLQAKKQTMNINQQNPYNSCINQTTQYKENVKKLLVHLSAANPGEIPSCVATLLGPRWDSPVPSVPVTITAPGTISIPAGATGTFNISFSGTGISNVAAQGSAGLSASVKMTGQGSTATVSIAAASNFTGGTVTLALTNSNRAILKSQQVKVTPPPNDTVAGAECAIGHAYNIRDGKEDKGVKYFENCLTFVAQGTYNKCGIQVCPDRNNCGYPLIIAGQKKPLHNIGDPSHIPPRGALVFFNCWDKVRGHIGISLGNGKFISAMQNATPQILESKLSDYKNCYLGWSYPSRDKK